jgi:hypothetical protein
LDEGPSRPLQRGEIAQRDFGDSVLAEDFQYLIGDTPIVCAHEFIDFL